MDRISQARAGFLEKDFSTSSQIVIAAGFAATFAESISMAAVAYTSKLAEADYYNSEYEREKWEIENVPS